MEISVSWFLCHWLMCEPVTQPSKIIFCSLIEFLITKTTQNSISHTLGPKNFKSPLLNPTTGWGVPNNIKSAPKFLNKFLFWFKWIFNENLFDINFSTAGQTLCNSVHHSLLIKDFPMISRVWLTALWFGRYQHDHPKTKTKKSLLIDRYLNKMINK